VDLTPRSIEISKSHLAVFGMQGNFLITDAERLPFANESFDVVYSNGVLHHTPDTALAVRELHRVLRPGGEARVMLYHRSSVTYWLNIIVRYGILNAELVRGLSPEEIMSRHVELSDYDSRPLVKVYSRREVRELFSMFGKVDVQIEQLTRGDFHFLGRFIPDASLRNLSRRVGWNLIIFARK